MKKLLLLLITIIGQNTQAQQIEDAWVYFNDKPQSATYLANPTSMLSQRSLDRRARYGIALDIKDVPIEPSYINQISNSQGITVMAKSKWMNALHVQGVENDIRSLLNFSFVDNIEFANQNIGIVTRPRPKFSIKTETISKSVQTNYNYGLGYDQIHLMNGEVVHQNNFTGSGVLIGIIDAGFVDVDTEPFYSSLFTNNKIKDVYNFVDNDQNIYQYSYHGAGVLSTIAANDNANFVGTAPDADFALYLSEDVSQEMPIEETYWAEAIERADSLGVDVVNTSLGYQAYDRAEYTRNMDVDLDGNTSFITRVANIAVSRGIHVLVSAGNSAQNVWYKIGFPADSPSVITVGATDISGIRASFSSIGPTSDGRIKPDVMAVGKNASVFWQGQIRNMSGTSFSSPILCGMVACWVQAQPNLNPTQLKQQLLDISDRHNNPDNEYGYGIPDFSQAGFIMAINENTTDKTGVYPNPFKDVIYVKRDEKNKFYLITDLNGKVVKEGKLSSQIDLSNLNLGLYFLNIGNNHYKIVKK